MPLLKFCAFISEQIQAKTQILIEDVEDILLNNEFETELIINQYERNKKLFHLLSNHNKEIKQLLDNMLSITKAISELKRENIDIFELLINNLNINSNMILVDNRDDHASYHVFFIKKLLIEALEHALNYITKHGKMTRVIITQNSNKLICGVKFVCIRRNFNFQSLELTLIKCRALALANRATINIHCTKNFISLSFQIDRI